MCRTQRVNAPAVEPHSGNLVHQCPPGRFLRMAVVLRQNLASLYRQFRHLGCHRYSNLRTGRLTH
jgi:hypothetical protein